VPDPRASHLVTTGANQHLDRMGIRFVAPGGFSDPEQNAPAAVECALAVPHPNRTDRPIGAEVKAANHRPMHAIHHPDEDEGPDTFRVRYPAVPGC
jgi:hypothetical protein